MSSPSEFLKNAIIWGLYPPGGVGPGGVTPTQVQQFAFNAQQDVGANDAFVVNLVPAVTTLTDQLIISMNANHSNLTTTPTLKINGTPPKTIVTAGGDELIPGDVLLGVNYLFSYNLETDTFQLINPSLSIANSYLVQKNYFNWAPDIGTTNAYVANLPFAPLAIFVNGVSAIVEIANANTGASTLALNGSAATPIVTSNGDALQAGQLIAGQQAEFIYSEVFAAWQLTNPAGNPAKALLLQPNTAMPAGFNLGSLTTGLLKNTVTGGIGAVSRAVNAVDYWAPGDILTVSAAPVNVVDVPNKGYVDTLVAGVRDPARSCYGASTANLTGYTYNNGTAGVGATLTAGSNGVFTQDGIAIPVNSPWLYKNDTSGGGAYNGVYIVTDTGSVSTPAILTRATYFDTPTEINFSGMIPIQFGTSNADTGWLLMSQVTTIGTDPLNFIQFAAPLSTVTVPQGGTGVSSFVPNELILAGTTSTGPLQQITNSAFSGMPLVSTGASSPPNFNTSVYIVDVIDQFAEVVASFNGVSGQTGFAIFGNSSSAPYIQASGTSANYHYSIRSKGTGLINLVSNNVSQQIQVNTNAGVSLLSFPQSASQVYSFPAGGGTLVVDNTFRATLEANMTVPAQTQFTSGSGNYTVPTPAPLYLKVKVQAGGAGGAATGTSPGAATAGGSSTFGGSLVVCNGGAIGSGQSGGVGGTATVTAPAVGYTLQGQQGRVGWLIASGGANGGNSVYSGSGSGGPVGSAGSAATGYGSGGGGGGAGSTTASGGGGGAGGYAEVIIPNPTAGATYAYAVGAGGNGATAGTNGTASGAGAGGVIQITAYYQ